MSSCVVSIAWPIITGIVAALLFTVGSRYLRVNGRSAAAAWFTRGGDFGMMLVTWAGLVYVLSSSFTAHCT